MGEHVTISLYDDVCSSCGRQRESESVAIVTVPRTPPIRVFIIDSQPLIAAALQHLFAAHPLFEVAGTAQDVKAPMLRALAPDVVIVSQEHGTTDVCEAVSGCRAAVPSARVCVVACHLHPELAPRALHAGADGYAVKDIGESDFLAAVDAVHHGSTYLDPRIDSAPPQRGAAARRARTLNSLSPRETEVLKLIADGYSNREISIALSLSEKTIKNHISRIFTKLHITARTQAVIHAIKTGIA